jgi:phosphatidylethanolamine/phosphatidyl-N-methylethanolamine N-methyltransferase
MGIQSASSTSASLAEHFQIKDANEIFGFCVERKGDKSEALKVQIQRAAHFLKTGIWIDDRSICDYAKSLPDRQISTLFVGKRLQRKLVCYERGLFVPKTGVWNTCKKTAAFVREYFHDRETVGSICPSFKFLAKEIVSEIPKQPGAAPKRILEIGPGTGVFTDRIIKRMNPGDELHLVEFDEKFYLQLCEKYKDIPNVRIFHRSILDHTVEANNKYNFIVSGLPLNSFPAEMVGRVFRKTEELGAAEAKVSYFDYLFLPACKRLYFYLRRQREKKTEFERILAMKKDFHRKHGLRVGKVALNIFPARVLHHQLKVEA